MQPLACTAPYAAATGKMCCTYAAVRQQGLCTFCLDTQSLYVHCAVLPFACPQSVVWQTKSCGTLQEKHRWQMAAAKAGLKVVHDSWVVHFWCGQPAAVCCHAFCCPNGPVRPRLSAVRDDPYRVQLPVGRQVHVGGFCEHCHHSRRCEASSVPLLPGLSAFWLLQGSPNMLRAILASFMITYAAGTQSFCIFVLVILTVPYAVLLQRLQVCNT